MPLQFAEALPIRFQPATAHAALLARAGLALGEHVEFAVLGQQFGAQLRVYRLPGPIGQRRLVAGEPALGCADEVAHGRSGGTKFGEDFLGGNAAIMPHAGLCLVVYPAWPLQSSKFPG